MPIRFLMPAPRFVAVTLLFVIMAAYSLAGGKPTGKSIGKSSTKLVASAPRLIWSDEFDGNTLNPKWRAYYNTYGDGNNELPLLTPNNVSISGGTLKITARRETVTVPSNNQIREFTSGFISTRETGNFFPRFARYEIRAKLPHGQGLWPAFWLRHRSGAGVAEVDIMEYFHSQVPGKATQTLHLDGRTNLSKKTTFFETPTLTPAWHTWAVDIEPVNADVKFTFYVDDKAVHTYVDTRHDWSKVYLGQPLFDIAVNLAVGGNWVGHPDDALGYLRNLNRCAQSGTPPNACSAAGILRAVFPATYEVDYVRVWDITPQLSVDARHWDSYGADPSSTAPKP